MTQTPCKNCKFAVWNGNTQIDCEFGRIDTFRKQGKLIEAYDEEKEFYVIKKWCNGYNPHQDITPEEAIEVMRIPYSLLHVGAASFRIPSIQPKQIHIVSENNLKTDYEFTRLLRPMDYVERVNHLMHKMKHPYVVVIEDDEVKDELIERAEYIYNVELKPFVYLQTPHGVMFMRKVGVLGYRNLLDKLNETIDNKELIRVEL